MKKNRKVIVALGLFLVVGCVESPPGPSANSSNPDNNPTNNPSNNPDNNSENNPSSNDPIRGLVSFKAPSAAVHTNATVEIEIDVDGDATDVELLVGSDLLHTFNGTTYTWDTQNHPEGEHQLGLRFKLGDDEIISSDTRRVVIDRTSPKVVDSMPGAGEEGSLNAPIFLTFDEALDPASVSEETVSLGVSLNGDVTYSVTLSEDGKTIEISDASASVTPPYRVEIAFPGVHDLAGNPVEGGLSFNVLGWVQERFQSALSDAHYMSVGGFEYLVGYTAGSPNSILRVFKRGGEGWELEKEQTIGSLVAISADHTNDAIFIGLQRRTSISGSDVNVAQVYKFDVAAKEYIHQGQVAVGDSISKGSIALSVRPVAAGYRAAMATVIHDRLQVHKFSNSISLSASTTSTFPTNNYANVRYESLAVKVHDDDSVEVIFARCEQASTPCGKTVIERLKNTGTTWTTTASTGPSEGSAQCDEYTNFDATYRSGIPYLVYTYVPCSSSTLNIGGAKGTAQGWDNLFEGNALENMPELGPGPYTSHLTVNDSEQIFTLLASNTRTIVSRMDTDGTYEWMPELGEGLAPTGANAATSFRDPKLFIAASNQPIVTFRFGVYFYVWRLVAPGRL